jgi:hypothetical protein
MEAVTSPKARQTRCALDGIESKHLHFATLQLMFASVALQEESQSQPTSDSHSTGDDSAEDFDAEEASDTSDDNADVKDEVS